MDIDVNDMMPLQINEVIPDRPNLTDVYVKLSSSKFILLYKKGDTPDRERLENYSIKKQVQSFWVKKSFYHQYTLRNITMAAHVISNNRVPTKTKALLLIRASESLFAEMTHLGFNAHSFLRAKALIDVHLKLNSQPKEIRNLIHCLNDFDYSLQTKSIATATISVIIGSHLEGVSPFIYRILALSGLLRDIGFTELPYHLQTTPFEELSLHDKNLYYSHPVIGKKLISQVPNLDHELEIIIYEHEELPNGTGYPRQLKKMNIHPLSEIVILAGYLTELVIKTKSNPTPMPISRALDYIQNESGQPFNLKTLRALNSALGVIE